MKRAVVLLSGGMDSAVVLAIAQEAKYEAYAIARGETWAHITGIQRQRGRKPGTTSFLSEPEVLEIRRLFDRGDMTQAEIGKRMGVARQTVGFIGRRERWTDLPERC